MKENLEGQTITVYTDGGWKAHGKVELDERSRMGLVSDDGSVFIILKAKISMIQLKGEVTNSEAPQEAEDSQRYQLPTSRIASTNRHRPEDYTPTEENHLGTGNQYGSLIPADLLEGEAEGDAVDQFAVSWSGSSKGKIEVKVDPKEEA